MFYLEKDNEIVLFDEDKQKIINVLKDLPQYAGLEIKETERPILNFQFADTQEFEYKQAQLAKKIQTEEIKEKLRLLDEQRIRAIAEPSVKNEQTGETWLDYYNIQAAELRKQLNM